MMSLVFITLLYIFLLMVAVTLVITTALYCVSAIRSAYEEWWKNEK